MMRRTKLARGAGVLVLAAGFLSSGSNEPRRSRPTTACSTRTQASFVTRSQPLRFEINAGQWDPRVRFEMHDHAATLFITDDGMSVGIHDTPRRERDRQHAESMPVRTAFVTMKLVGARVSAPVGEHPLGSWSNFFLGNDSGRWRTHVANFGEVRARSWLPGVDVVWHGGDGGLEYDLDLAAGTDASKVELDVSGANALAIQDDGTLAISTDAGTILQRPPRVMQEGRVLRARYRRVSTRRFAFDIDGYRRNQPVLIDPTLVYSTYVGGATDADYVLEGSLAVDTSGSVYVTGLTYSSDYPTTTGAVQTTFGGSYDAIVTKLNAAGTALDFSTYLGGAGADTGYAIVLDSSGNACVAGYAGTGFPTTTGAYQTVHGGGNTDVFVLKLDATGALKYSTYLGGNSYDYGYNVAVDASGNAYVTGTTGGGTYPTTTGAYQTSFGGSSDVFIAKFDATLSSLTYSTYLGGSTADEAFGLAVDSSGNAYLGGATAGSFPTTTGAYQTTYAGGGDGFVAKINAAGSALLYSTYLGGSSNDTPKHMVIDSMGNAYLTGVTSSANYPVTTGAYQTTYDSGDAFVTKVNASGTALVYSTYLGGAGHVSRGWEIAIDGSGNALIVGGTSGAFPTTTDAVQTTYGGGANDAFVTKLDPAGDALVFSTYLGGSADDQAYAIAIDANGDDYVAGYTGGNFTTTTGAYQTTYAGGTTDIFIAKLHDSSLSVSPSSATVSPKGSQSFSATGGSGTGYAWSFKTNASGGTINASTGEYTAGTTGSVVDVVQVTDSNNDTATASVTVGTGVSVLPASPMSPPKGALSFSSSGGSGTGYTFALTTNGSGGSINASTGAYTAGATGSVDDVVTATDSLGNSGSTTVTVGPGVSISPSTPATPPNGDIAFSASGGSDAGFAWSISSNNSGGTIDGSSGAYTAGATGSVVDTVGVLDSLGNAATVNVSVGGGLAINPASPSAPPKGSVAFNVTGGSGTGFAWSLATNNSGGSIDASSGAYTAGSTPSVTDVVSVTDSLSNTSNVNVTVTAPVSISPTTATLAPGASTTFSAAGGSGTGYAWSLATNVSGGNVTSSGVYTAGATGGVADTVRLVDSLGNSATATVTVEAIVVSDAGSPPVQDASTVDAGGGSEDNGGCGCKSAGHSTSKSNGIAILVLTLLAVNLSRRRNRTGSGAQH